MWEQRDDIDAYYAKSEKLGEGTYGIVYLAHCKRTEARVALKKITLEDADEGCPSTALREIAYLQELDHPNVVKLLDVHVGSSALHLVFEHCDMDLRQFLKQHGPLRGDNLLIAAKQCLLGIRECHAHRILHRDLKPQNLLVCTRDQGPGSLGGKFIIRLADFGLARAFNVPVKPYTHEVVTLWYRPPEVLLGAKMYVCPVDIWSLGCIVGEMSNGQAMFPGDCEIGCIFKIFHSLGTPSDAVWPGVSQLPYYMSSWPRFRGKAFDESLARPGTDRSPALPADPNACTIVRWCLRYDPAERQTAASMLQQPLMLNVGNEGN